MHVLCEQLGRNLLRSGRRGSQFTSVSFVEWVEVKKLFIDNDGPFCEYAVVAR